MGAHGEILPAGAVTLMLPDPRVRALCPDDLDRISTFLEAASEDDRCSVVLVRSPPGTFCLGVGLAGFAEGADLDRLSMSLRRCFRAFALSRRPILAAVDGPAVGFGLTMLLHADVVLASERASFQAPFIGLGLVPEAASTLLLPNRIGHLNAVRLLYLGEVFTADEARSVGLATEVVPSTSLSPRLCEIARQFARAQADALEATRNLVRGDLQSVLGRIDMEVAACRRRLEEPAVRRRITKLTTLSRRSATGAAALAAAE